MSAQVAADLRAAADVLERDGWTQGTYHDRTGCHCADGAIAVATGSHRAWFWNEDGNLIITEEGDRKAYRRWQAAFNFASSLTAGDTIIGWNDAPDRTAVEVIAALRVAADKAAES